MATSPTPRDYEAKDVFQTALGFNAACDFLAKIDHKTDPVAAAFMGHPMISLSALTIELLLKTLHALHSDNPVPGHHHLGKLYRGLSLGNRNAVQKRWKPIYTEWHERWDQMRIKATGPNPGQTPKEVEAALDEGAKAFEQARYNFEPGSRRFNYYLDGLRKPLVRLVAERHPEIAQWRVRPELQSWEELARKVNRPPKE